MNLDRIVIRRTDTNRGYYTVEADGRICTFLCWGEMIEMLIHLTHPEIKGPRYHWRTVDEEMADEDRRKAPLPQHPPEPSQDRLYSCDVCNAVSPTPMNACSRNDCQQIPF